jgi:hypothetical protein
MLPEVFSCSLEVSETSARQWYSPLLTCSGSATSPDALFIYASVDAAAEILSICLRLSKQGVLKYLPSRYLTNFVYAGVFSLKSAYSGAQGRGDLAK